MNKILSEPDFVGLHCYSLFTLYYAPPLGYRGH